MKLLQQIFVGSSLYGNEYLPHLQQNKKKNMFVSSYEEENYNETPFLNDIIGFSLDYYK